MKPSGLGRILTIGQVAELAGWSYKRMRRRLVALHYASGESLLQERRGPRGRIRWTVSLEVLKNIAPRWFAEHDAEEIADMRTELDRVRRELDLAIEQIGALSRAAHA